MTPFATVLLLVWPLLVLMIGSMYRGVKGITIAYVTAYLLLPSGAIPISGLPNYSKLTATAIGAVMIALLYDRGELSAFRFKWFDIPILVWCILPPVTAMRIGDGMYESLSSMYDHVHDWAAPYFIGRIYFSNSTALSLFGRAIVVGCLLYVPALVYELRMGPTIQQTVYGFAQQWHGLRYGGFRPYVFLGRALECGMFLSIGSLAAVWLFRKGMLPRVLGLPGALAVGILLIITVLEKTTGALLLMCLGFTILAAMRVTRSKWPLWLWILVPPIYVETRASQTWHAQELINFAGIFGEDRAQSVEYRITCEDEVIEKTAGKQPWGWSRFGGRWRKFNERGEPTTRTDGRWMITLGCLGYFGVTTWLIVCLLPAILLLRRFRVAEILSPECAGITIFAIAMVLWCIDGLMNAMYNPLYLLAAGGVNGLTRSKWEREWASEVPAELDTPSTLESVSTSL
jgi:hypothetical protein